MNWDYIAGFFESGGSLRIAEIKEAYQLQVRLYASEELMLKEIKSFCGFGNLYQNKSKSSDNLYYELSITKKQYILFFLKNIVDRLIMKKKIVEFLLKNYKFERDNNSKFDIERFRKLIKRAGVNK